MTELESYKFELHQLKARAIRGRLTEADKKLAASIGWTFEESETSIRFVFDYHTEQECINACEQFAALFPTHWENNGIEEIGDPQVDAFGVYYFPSPDVERTEW